MLTHIVLLKFEDPAAVAEALRRAEELERADPILRLKAGRNLADTDQSYDVALVLRLADRAALTELEDHPRHREWRAFLATVEHRAATVLMADEWTHS